MSELTSRLAANLAAVQARIGSACALARRDPRDVRLVAVVKYAAWEWIRGLIDLGIRDFAENRPQQLVERAARLAAELPAAEVRWHLIGHLQRNKVRPVLTVANCIHSVDSLRLLQRIDGLAAESSLRPRVLLEVNVSGESTKDGFDPAVLRAEWPQLADCAYVELCGLMTMAPHSDDPAAAFPTFDALRQLRDELTARSDGRPLPELSMGMSGDFEAAIQAGATLLRIGSRLFEGC